ncbi:MAG: DUF1499 domain-containing protein [Pseudomonadota bacterium]
MQQMVLLSITWLIGAYAIGQGPTSEGVPMRQVLSPCPVSPNCVSSLSEKTRHRIEPLRHAMAHGEAFERLRVIVEAMPRARITHATHDYLHAEFKTAVFGFIDDLEFAIADTPGTIHVRSASRAGYWDLGVNRRRVERILQAFSSTDG